jgi:hypothetical protein
MHPHNMMAKFRKCNQTWIFGGLESMYILLYQDGKKQDIVIVSGNVKLRIINRKKDKWSPLCLGKEDVTRTGELPRQKQMQDWTPESGLMNINEWTLMKM